MRAITQEQISFPQPHTALLTCARVCEGMVRDVSRVVGQRLCVCHVLAHPTCIPLPATHPPTLTQMKCVASSRTTFRCVPCVCDVLGARNALSPSHPLTLSPPAPVHMLLLLLLLLPLHCRWWTESLVSLPGARARVCVLALSHSYPPAYRPSSNANAQIKRVASSTNTFRCLPCVCCAMCVCRPCARSRSQSRCFIHSHSLLLCTCSCCSCSFHPLVSYGRPFPLCTCSCCSCSFPSTR